MSSVADNGLCVDAPLPTVKDKFEGLLLMTPKRDRSSLRPKYADALALVSKERLIRSIPVNPSQSIGESTSSAANKMNLS